MTIDTSSLSGFSRRQLLQSTACGFGGLALGGMVSELAQAATGPLASPQPHFPSRAKRVIFLFMSGGPSQPDLFDEKKLMIQKHGEPISPPIDGRKVSVGVDKYLALGPSIPIRPRGESGMTISDLMPHLAKVADDLCMLRAVHADSEAHAPATLQLHTGMAIDARPSMGSWFSYGLGTENQNLPSFISIHPFSDVRTYGSGFLPAAHQGTPVVVPNSDRDSAIKYLIDPQASVGQQRRRLDMVQRFNKRLLDRVDSDQQMEGMIGSFELAFRMQAETPKLVDLSGESKATHELYGIGEKDTDRNGRACLLARRLSEAGVRFVQLTIGGWDHHGDIRGELPKTCAASDKPVAGLIQDLKARGLLDETLVVWSGEFGRTPWSQDVSGTSPIDKHGREHQPESFCTLLAGGGVKGGMTYGETDDFGFKPIDGKVHLHDLHATMQHLLGFNHERLTYRHHGRDYRLTDVFGSVVNEILASPPVESMSSMTNFSFILCDPVESFGGLKNLASVFRTLKKLGFAGVEFNLVSPGLPDAEGLLKVVEEIELPIVSFLTGANYFGKGLCLSSPNEETRRKAVDNLCRFSSTAAQFGAVLVIGQMQGFRSDEPDRAVAEDRIENALRQVATAAEENGATVVVEPVNHLQCGFHNTLESVLNLTDRIGSARLKPMLDSFHINIEERSMTEPILRVGQALGHFHLCDSNGGFLGSGHLDIGAIIGALDCIAYRGYVSVKVYREAWEHAARATMDFLKSKRLAESL